MPRSSSFGVDRRPVRNLTSASPLKSRRTIDIQAWLPQPGAMPKSASFVAGPQADED
jgi:hypothetical protein